MPDTALPDGTVRVTHHGTGPQLARGDTLTSGRGVDCTVRLPNGNWGGSSVTTSSVKPQDLPAGATIGTRTSFGKTVSGFISPVR